MCLFRPFFVFCIIFFSLVPPFLFLFLFSSVSFAWSLLSTFFCFSSSFQSFFQSSVPPFTRFVRPLSFGDFRHFLKFILCVCSALLFPLYNFFPSSTSASASYSQSTFLFTLLFRRLFPSAFPLNRSSLSLVIFQWLFFEAFLFHLPSIVVSF